MESNDNIIKLTSGDNQESEEALEIGRCFASMKGGHRAMTLEIRVPIGNTRDNLWRRKLIPYNLIEDCEQSPEGIVIVTHSGVVVTIEGDDLDRIFNEIGNVRLRMVRPLLKGESRKENEPRPNKITIEEPQ